MISGENKVRAMTELESPSYVCTIPDIYENPECPYECIGVESCQSCQCSVRQSGGGPWGEAMDVILCLIPIVFLLGATLAPKPLPTTVSLPLAAFLMFLIRLMYLGSDPILTCASVISGIHEALTPLSIMAGAIMLFESMEATNCMPYMMREMKALTNGHVVTELMIIFAFAYMVEGASGFGTPVALGVPMLVSMGHPELDSVVTLLVMNTFATVWGAAGTPIWFGFGGLGLSESEFIEISYKAGAALTIAAYFLVPFVLWIMLPFNVIRSNAVFVVLALSGCVLPSLGLSFVSYEFPALIGGMIGCALTTILIRFRVGLKPFEMTEAELGRNPMEIGSVSERSIVEIYKKDMMMRSGKSSIGEKNHDVSNNGEALKNDGMMISELTNATNDVLGAIGSEQPNANILKSDSMMISELTGTSQKNNAVVSFATSDPADETTANDAVDKANPSSDPVDISESGQVIFITKNSVESEQEQYVHIKNNLTVDSNEDEEKGEMSLGGTTVSLLAINEKLGPRKKIGEGYVKELIGRTFPFWGTVLILILTRVPQIGLKDFLTRTEPYFKIDFNTYGIFKMSASLVLMLENILTYPQLNWKYELLYVPFLVPFTLVSFMTLGIYRKELNCSVGEIISTVVSRLANPAIALLGALVLVQLMINGGESSPANIIGTILAEAFKGGWIAIAAFIGVLGSFFSGSTTISNLTFGEVQIIAASKIDTSETAMLALQAVGASAGNGVCINNIISACTVVGLCIREGKVIGMTWKIVLGSAITSTIVMLALFFRF